MINTILESYSTILWKSEFGEVIERYNLTIKWNSLSYVGRLIERIKALVWYSFSSNYRVSFKKCLSKTRDQTLRSVEAWNKILKSTEKDKKLKSTSNVLRYNSIPPYHVEGWTYSTNPDAFSQLWIAIKESQVDKVKNIVSLLTSFDFNLPLGNGQSLFDLALEYGNLEIIDSLVKAGAKNTNEYCILHKAAEQNRIDIVRYLLDHGINPTLPCQASHSAFIGYKILSVVAQIIMNKPDVDLEMIKLIVQYMDGDAKNQDSLDYATQESLKHGRADIFEYLLQQGGTHKEFFEDPKSFIIKAIENEHLEVLQLLHKRDINLHFLTDEGLPLLHIAAAFKKRTIVNFLIEDVKVDFSLITKSGIIVEDFVYNKTFSIVIKKGLHFQDYARYFWDAQARFILEKVLMYRAFYHSVNPIKALDITTLDDCFKYIFDRNLKLSNGDLFLHCVMKKFLLFKDWQNIIETCLKNGANPLNNNLEKKNAFLIALEYIDKEVVDAKQKTKLKNLINQWKLTYPLPTIKNINFKNYNINFIYL